MADDFFNDFMFDLIGDWDLVAYDNMMASLPPLFESEETSELNLVTGQQGTQTSWNQMGLTGHLEEGLSLAPMLPQFQDQTEDAATQACLAPIRQHQAEQAKRNMEQINRLACMTDEKQIMREMETSSEAEEKSPKSTEPFVEKSDVQPKTSEMQMWKIRDAANLNWDTMFTFERMRVIDRIMANGIKDRVVAYRQLGLTETQMRDLTEHYYRQELEEIGEHVQFQKFRNIIRHLVEEFDARGGNIVRPDTATVRETLTRDALYKYAEAVLCQADELEDVYEHSPQRTFCRLREWAIDDRIGPAHIRKWLAEGDSFDYEADHGIVEDRREMDRFLMKPEEVAHHIPTKRISGVNSYETLCVGGRAPDIGEQYRGYYSPQAYSAANKTSSSYRSASRGEKAVSKEIFCVNPYLQRHERSTDAGPPALRPPRRSTNGLFIVDRRGNPRVQRLVQIKKPEPPSPKLEGRRQQRSLTRITARNSAARSPVNTRSRTSKLSRSPTAEISSTTATKESSTGSSSPHRNKCQPSSTRKNAQGDEGISQISKRRVSKRALTYCGHVRTSKTQQAGRAREGV